MWGRRGADSRQMRQALGWMLCFLFLCPPFSLNMHIAFQDLQCHGSACGTLCVLNFPLQIPGTKKHRVLISISDFPTVTATSVNYLVLSTHYSDSQCSVLPLKTWYVENWSFGAGHGGRGEGWEGQAYLEPGEDPPERPCFLLVPVSLIYWLSLSIWQGALRESTGGKSFDLQVTQQLQ